MHCAACGRVASLGEMQSQLHGRGGVVPGNADAMPVGTKIQRRVVNGGVEWLVPASGKSGGLLVFAVIWLSFITVFSSLAIPATLAGEMKDSSSGEPASLLMVLLFLSVFWAAGLGMAYAAVRMKYSQHQLQLTAESLTLVRVLWGRRSTKSLARHAVRTVEQAVFYTQNYSPVYGIEIRGDRQKLRFGSTLSDDERAWLVANIERELRGVRVAHSPVQDADAASKSSEPLVASTAAASACAVAGGSAISGVIPSALSSAMRPAAAFHDGRLSSHAAGSVFRVEVPRSRAVFYLSIGLMVFFGIFIAVGLHILRGSGGIASTAQTLDSVQRVGWSIGDLFPLIVRWYETGFGSLWLLVSVLGEIVAVGMFYYQLQRLGWQQVIVGDASYLRLQQEAKGKVVHEIKHPRSQWRDVRTYVTGSMNGQPTMAVELHIGDRVEKIAGWMKQSEAAQLERELRQQLPP